MNREQLENIYKSNGIGDFQLGNLEDLMKIHGINARQIEGYSELSDDDKKAYEKFIIKFMNGMGLSSRISFYPKKIYRAVNVDYLIEEESGSYFNFAGETWNVTNKDKKIKVGTWGDIQDISNTGVIKETKEDYLRIEYSHYDREEWLHIIKNGEECY